MPVQCRFLSASHGITVIKVGSLDTDNTGFEGIRIIEFSASVCEDIFNRVRKSKAPKRFSKRSKTSRTELSVFRFMRGRKKQLFPCKKEGKQRFRGTNNGMDGVHLYKRFQLQLLKISVSPAIKNTVFRYL